MLEKIIKDKIGDWALKGSMDGSLMNNEHKALSSFKRNNRRAQRLRQAKKSTNNMQLVLF